MSPEALATLLDEPALAAPSGVTANFDNPPNSNTLAWVVTTFCTVVLTICFLLRIFARLWLDRRVGIEEVLMIGAYGAYWGTAYAGYALIYTPGYYVHTWNLHNKDLIRPLYLILIYGCCYSAVLPLIKTAILLDWCRIFVPLNRTRNAFWWGCVSVITLQCVWGVLCILLLNMQCRPHEAIWKFYLPSKCYSLPDVMLTSASVQVASDITMFFLPQRIIWRLQMNWQKKIGVSIIFGVGILASVAACFRLSHTVAFANTTDTMYLIGPLLFWACGEMTCGFFILSVPCLSKLIIESGLPRSVKQSLGFGSKPSEPSYEDSEQPHRSGQSDALRSHPMRPWLKGTDTIWSKIGDEDHDHDALRNSGKSESQTSLHRAQADGRN
ncbi:hypothetical protein ABZX51_009818 [Aspergillus tubingensis]|uniref:Rhodopsin domain-containing protein n=2 Tax=Aspergillus subgen. Circumdati TaxID=2720871 RepID=A0A1L9NHW1_ASPTC|nr:hypothetical protein BO79DRAFT_237767 [Aspergillus costaricaensis CBS 115574]XP_035361696.1 putative 60s ribosomal protein l36 protein [Aspergillus tubingensis]OJI88845.1 hypothetical protein ASPTUDRAFT_49753 [Aspergillus tubingensis CBS 134.48]RAK88542.1 hypothetical protein BO79DRAFT_237767 [Aspergillus costaricaensis CBS 115574]GFN20892.1 putative 60s ribosomal protein l36 protein [Aspergillus tubingensis]